ncbi:MAG TPA: ABC transporter permease [Bacteroidia bacterium]|nr:ABC transporter permease [Bacteroidia bacterium]
MEFFVVAFLLGLAYVPLALGIFLSAKVFNIPDITTDGSFTLGAASFAIMITNSVNPLLAIILVMPMGAIAGAITGIIHTKLKVNALLSGILVMTALYSINLLIMGRSNIPLINTASIFQEVNNPNFLLINLLKALGMIILLVIIIIWLLKTDFGLTMRAAGSNETMIEAQGVNPNKIKIIGLALSNALVAFSAGLVTQLQGFVDVNMGIGIVIAGLASVMMGETISNKFKRSTIILPIIMVAIAAVLFRLFIAFILVQGVEQVYVKLLTALLVLIFLSLSNLKFIKKN